MHRVEERLFANRWYIGVGLFLLCVLLEIHGSSIGMYSDLLHTSNGTLWGKLRPIRSDEWVVNTPLAFSQYYSHFAYFSDIVRGSATDMFMVYGQAVRDLAVIFRPFEWGYLVLSPAKGLAFFWMGRWIFLFLVSVEFGMLVAEKNKRYALLYGLLIALSPLVQWWFAVNSIAEILIFGQAGLLFLYHYLRETDVRRRWIYGLGIAWSLGIYIFSLYPAWQVSCGYVFLVLAIWIWSQYGRQKVWEKLDFCILGIGILLVAVLSAAVIYRSAETIQLVKDTIYPGSRVSIGGAMDWYWLAKSIFNYALGLWLPVKDLPIQIVPVIVNNCEAARMFDLVPLGALLAGFYLCRIRQRDSLLKMLLVLQGIFLLWWIFSWPVWFAKLTMLSNVPDHRLFLAFGLVNILLLVRTLSLWETPLARIPAGVMSGIGAAIALWASYQTFPEMFNYRYVAATVVIVFLLWYFSLRRNVMSLLLCGMIVMLFVGLRVNPVVHGVGSIYDSPAVKAIQEITEHDPARWLAIGDGAYNNIPLMAGAKTVNSINAYPNFEMWHALDPDRQYETVYNRYAHIPANVVDTPTTFELLEADAFLLNINIDDLDKIGVKYIFSIHELKILDGKQVHLKKIFNEDRLYIYEVVH